jgi:CRAL/TRIO domain
MATPGKGPKRTETDVSSTGSEASSSEAGNLMKYMMETKGEGGKSRWTATLETMGLVDGKKKKDDILCDNFEEALKAFMEMVQDQDFQFASTPFEHFQSTKEDLFKAFVHWSRKTEDDRTYYNPSNGFRRLEEYVKWMDKNCKSMDYKISTMKEMQDAWSSKLARDKQGRLVWWVDVGVLDFKLIKSLPSDDVLCYFVWFCHLLLFDKLSQENGFMVVESMAFAGLMESMTIVSPDVKNKLDRLTIGVLPIKFEGSVIFNNPTWLRIIMALMGPFMSKKMRTRITVLPNDTHPQAFFDENFGRENIPLGFAQLEGTFEKDIVERTFNRLMGIGAITDEVET